MDIAGFDMRTNSLSNNPLTEEREKKLQCKQKPEALCKVK